MKNLKILYVEDDILTRKMLTAQLKSRFSDVYDAADGVEGLEKYKELDPDVIITDISMPKMNGYEMIENIKSINSDAKIIITSAFSEDSEKSKNYKVVSKPIIVEKLYSLITEVV